MPTTKKHSDGSTAMAEAETTYTKKIDGVVRERTAYTPADHVELEFAGWVRKDGKPSTAATDAKPAK